MLVGESWDAFTKQVLVEKHISGIMCENSSVPLAPSADAHAYNLIRH